MKYFSYWFVACVAMCMHASRASQVSIEDIDPAALEKAKMRFIYTALNSPDNTDAEKQEVLEHVATMVSGSNDSAQRFGKKDLENLLVFLGSKRGELWNSKQAREKIRLALQRLKQKEWMTSAVLKLQGSKVGPLTEGEQRALGRAYYEYKENIPFELRLTDLIDGDPVQYLENPFWGEERAAGSVNPDTFGVFYNRGLRENQQENSDILFSYLIGDVGAQYYFLNLIKQAATDDNALAQQSLLSSMVERGDVQDAARVIVSLRSTLDSVRGRTTLRWQKRWYNEGKIARVMKPSDYARMRKKAAEFKSIEDEVHKRLGKTSGVDAAKVPGLVFERLSSSRDTQQDLIVDEVVNAVRQQGVSYELIPEVPFDVSGINFTL